MRLFVAALRRQSTRIVSCQRGKERGGRKRCVCVCVKEFLTDAHIGYVMSQDVEAIYRLLKYPLLSPFANTSSPHSCGALTPQSRR
jgi:hypothetical protein